MNAQRLFLNALSKLPAGALRLMTGSPIAIRGAKLDPHAQLLWVAGKKQPSLVTMTPTEARAGLEDAAQTLQPDLPPSITTREAIAPGPGGEIPVRIYIPANADRAIPVTVFFHFGGFVIGSRTICHGFCGMLAGLAQTIVVSVEYRLAPEHPFPAPVEDAIAAYRWTLEHAAEFGGDPSRIAVAGDSAGGQLAAVVCQEALRQNWRLPVCQVLIYPWLVPHSGMPSYEDFAQAYPLSAEIMAWFSNHYFNCEDDKKHPWAAPLNEANLAGLPPAIITTAGFDPLRDEGEAYAEKLKAAGVPVTYHCFENLPHAFTMMGGVIPAANAACRQIAHDLAAALQK